MRLKKGHWYIEEGYVINKQRCFIYLVVDTKQVKDFAVCAKFVTNSLDSRNSMDVVRAVLRPTNRLDLVVPLPRHLWPRKVRGVWQFDRRKAYED